MSVLLVALGGFIGSVARFYLSVKTNKHLVGTWIVNITGSIVLAFFIYLHGNQVINTHLWIFAGVGFCGAYTTFSTFGNETLQLIMDKKYKAAIGYVCSSLFISLLCVFVVWYIFDPSF